MKWTQITAIALLLCLLLAGCSGYTQTDIAATTLPVYCFTQYLCRGTPLQVDRVITENVSCLHDYTLQVRQMQLLQGASAVVISGAGLEDFMDDALSGSLQIIDASGDIALLEGADHCHDHEEDHHDHEHDPHIWLSPDHARMMADNICAQLCQTYPQHRQTFEVNLDSLHSELQALKAYGQEKLRDLTCRELVTFHDGFAYLAQAFDLTVLKAVEEESGSEASAAELIELAQLIQEHQLPAIFTETNGSVSAAQTVAAETGVPIFTLDMCMSEGDYFEAMYRNIDTLWEALQ